MLFLCLARQLTFEVPNIRFHYFIYNDKSTPSPVLDAVVGVKPVYVNVLLKQSNNTD